MCTVCFGAPLSVDCPRCENRATHAGRTLHRPELERLHLLDREWTTFDLPEYLVPARLVAARPGTLRDPRTGRRVAKALT